MSSKLIKFKVNPWNFAGAVNMVFPTGVSGTAYSSIPAENLWAVAATEKWMKQYPLFLDCTFDLAEKPSMVIGR
jgi:hypothetical protein